MKEHDIDNNNDTLLFTDYSLDTPEFSLNGYNTYGRLVDVTDGDSLSIVLPLSLESIVDSKKIYLEKSYFYKYRVRLFGIDTCELKSKNEENKKLGLSARKKLVELVTNKKIDHDITKQEIREMLDKEIILLFVECLDFDKYGRLLANVYLERVDEKVNLSNYLIQNKLAYKYTGGTKLNENEQLEILN